MTIVQKVLPSSPAAQKNRRLCDDPDVCHLQLLRCDIIQCMNGRDGREGMLAEMRSCPALHMEILRQLTMPLPQRDPSRAPQPMPLPQPRVAARAHRAAAVPSRVVASRALHPTMVGQIMFLGEGDASAQVG